MSEPSRALRVDLGYVDGCPTIRMWTADRAEHVYPLNPAETAAIVRRLATALQNLLTDSTADRTEESKTANPDLYRRDDEQEPK